MPTGLHLGIGFAVLAAMIFGLLKVTEAKPAGGGANLRIRSTEVDGRRYNVIDRGFGQYEVLSPDDGEAWIIFDANAPGSTVKPIAAGSRGADVISDMQRFPTDLFS